MKGGKMRGLLSRWKMMGEGRVSRCAAMVPPHYQAGNCADPGVISGERKSLEWRFPAGFDTFDAAYPPSIRDDESVQRASALSNLPRGALSIMRLICASSGRSNAGVLRTT